MQVWLQDFAWTEEEAPERLSQRKLRGQGMHDVQRLAAEPIFCIETALKLHHWSSLAYTHTDREVGSKEGAQARDALAANDGKQVEDGLIEAQMHVQGAALSCVCP